MTDRPSVTIFVKFHNFGKGWECIATTFHPSDKAGWYRVCIPVPADELAPLTEASEPAPLIAAGEASP